MPDDFDVSERVRAWAAEKGYDRLPEHLEAFKRKAVAKGYTYASWDDAFMEAIREDWAKLRGRAANGAAPAPSLPTTLPQWCIDAGFEHIAEAENARCHIGNFREFRGGKRIAQGVTA